MSAPIEMPRLSVIIPHYNGKEILLRCLQALGDDAAFSVEVLVVDNASVDDSIEAAKSAFPAIRVVRSEKNLGYAGGCNLGMQAARADFFVLLNNDAMISLSELQKLWHVVQKQPEIAAVQPKIRSITNTTCFDYAGAAGGFIDVMGFPFARGRIFFTIEEDTGQYDQPGDIFWASGTCTLLRREAVEKTGLLDESFFAHMEEIDLNWRFHLLGYRVWYEPGEVVHHDAGTTLRPETPMKIYLNHRNSLLMLLKNYRWPTLCLLFPLRLILEVIAVLFVLVQRDVPQAKAIVRGCLAVGLALPQTLRARKIVQKKRILSDAQVFRRMFKNSIVVQYFLLKRKTFESLDI